MQSAWSSFIEGLVNETLSFAINFAVQLGILPLFGITVQVRQGLLIAALFTSISLVRLFALRRLFNWWSTRRATCQG